LIIPSYHNDIIYNKTKFIRLQKTTSVTNTISVIYKTFYSSDRSNGNKIAVKQSSK